MANKKPKTAEVADNQFFDGEPVPQTASAPVPAPEFPYKLFINPLFATPASIAYVLNSLGIAIDQHRYDDLDPTAKSFFTQVG